MTDFRSVLQVDLSSIKAPTPLPEGTYYGVIENWTCGDSNKNRTPYVRFSVKLHSAGDDVSLDDLADINLSTRKLTTDFYMTPDAQYRLKLFLESLGFELTGSDFSPYLADSVGQNVIVYVTQRFNPENPEDPPRNNIKSIKGEK